jgi:mono/diheme cytochrome c family protein
MTNQRNEKVSLRRLSVGFSAAVIGVACGGVDSPDPGLAGGAVAAPVQVEPVRRETCDDNPLLAGCPGPVGAPAPAPGSAPDASDPAALAKAAAENILASNCGQCHGPALTEAQARAGMNYINDIDRLVQTGKIVPLNSASSRIVQRMVRGEMPPVSAGLPRVTEADITVVSDYIDNPRFWPLYTPEARSCAADGQLVDFDELFQEINSDLARADNDDTQFYRYISLTNRFTAGVCADALDRDRQGLTKMLNMLSVRASIERPVPINTEETIYRIDLRDFDWDRGIDVDGQGFNDVWEAIAENNPYAVLFEGDDADDAVADTQTDFPVMFADQMLDVAVIGNLYYGIIGVDTNQGLSAFIENELGIDVQANIEDEEAIRAGTTRSRISRQDRVVERHDIEIRGGVLWQSFDFADDDDNENIFEDPFGFAPGGTEAIFTLPNGMLGFIIADENDNIVEDSDILLDTNQNNFRAITSVSCSNCHTLGFIPVVDEVADVALANARNIGLNRDEVEQLEAIYVSPEQFARQVQSDSSGFYQRALQQADLPVQGGDPVSNVFLRFDADMKLADAAGDLGVTPDDLSDSLNLLDPVLTVLRRGALDRDDFTDLYIASLCELSITLENQPEANLCDDAIQDLEDRRR